MKAGGCGCRCLRPLLTLARLPAPLCPAPPPQDPCRLLAVKGCEELLTKCGERVLPVIPQLVLPLKAALKSADRDVVATALRMLQLLARACPRAGEALLPYYRQLLPPLNRWGGGGTGRRAGGHTWSGGASLLAGRYGVACRCANCFEAARLVCPESCTPSGCGYLSQLSTSELHQNCNNTVYVSAPPPGT